MLPEVAARVARVEESSLRVRALASLSDEELAQRDVAELNLLCADGLPGADDLDVAAYLARLDEWTDMVDYGTRRSLSKLRATAEPFQRCPARFRMLVLVTILRRNLALSYNTAFAEGEYDASDSRNLFLHGLLNGSGGTCVTFPVLYVAIGRRLGYPLFVVQTAQHLFCRWDDGHGTRFNIEATAHGFAPVDDEYYRDWPIPVSDEGIRSHGLWSNLTPRHELADFVSHRAACLLDNLLFGPAAYTYQVAAELAPGIQGYASLFLKSVMLCRIAAAQDKLSQSCGAKYRTMSQVESLAMAPVTFDGRMGVRVPAQCAARLLEDHEKLEEEASRRSARCRHFKN